MKSRASLPVLFAIATLAIPIGASTGCVGTAVESPLRAHARAHTAKGEHARAYADLRAALHYEIPPRDPMHAQARTETAEALASWYAARIDEARALSRRGKLLDALKLLQRLARDDLGRMPWDAREQTHGAVLTPRIPEALLRARATETSAVVDALLDAARARQAAGALDDAVVRAEAIERIVPGEPRVAAFRQVATSAAAAKHEALAAERTASGHAEAAAFHRALVDRYRTGVGKRPVSIPQVVFVQPPRCTFAEGLARREVTVGVPVEVTLVDERCEVTRRDGNVVKEEYSHRAIVEKYVQVGESCTYTGGSTSTSFGCVERSVSGSGTGGCSSYGQVTTSSPGTKTCTPRYEMRKVQDTVTGLREIRIDHVVATWSGRAHVRAFGIELSIPFSVTEETPERHEVARDPRDLDRTALRHEDQRAEAEKKAFDRLVVQVEDKTRAAVLAHFANQRARPGLSTADVEELLVRELGLSLERLPEITAHVRKHYGIGSATIRRLVARPPAPPKLAGFAFKSDLPPRTTCMPCYARRASADRVRAAHRRPTYSLLALSWLGGTNAQDGGLSHGGAAGFELRQVPGSGVGASWGFGTRLGAGLGGLVYDLWLTPLGVGWRGGPAAASLQIGGGLGGITGGRLPFSWSLPVDASLRLRISSRASMRLGARAAWVTDDARQNGAAHAPFGDEASVSLGVGLGGSYNSFDTLGRWDIGVQLAEAGGETYVGLSIGVGVGETD